MPTLPANALPSDPDPAASSPVKETPARDKLGSADRDLLAEAKAAGDKNVTMIVATEPGETRRRRGRGRADSAALSAYAPTGSATSAPPSPPARSETAISRDVVTVDLKSTIAAGRPGRRQRCRGRRLGRGPGADHPGRQPVQPDPRDRRGRLQTKPPDGGRPRRHHRHPRLRCRPRPPGAAEDHHRRAQDRRLGHRDRPAARRRRHLARHADPVTGPTFTFARPHLDRARGHATRSTASARRITAAGDAGR